MNQIQNELGAAKNYLLTTVTDDEGNTLVELSFSNAAKVEAMIQNDSLYKRELNNVYDDRSMYRWFMAIKETSKHFNYENIYAAVTAVDNSNSTHLNANKSKGNDEPRKEVTEAILNLGFDTVDKDLREGGFLTYNTIAFCTSNRKKNKSFASKFCSFWCYYVYEGMPEQDNYSRYDSIVRKYLPKYLKYFEIKEVFDLDNYESYCRAIDAILGGLKQKGVEISRNAFDHLIWYYHK